MFSHTPDPILQTMLQTRESYLKKFKSNDTIHSTNTITAHNKLLKLIEEDVTVKEFNRMMAKLAAIETASKVAESELLVFRNSINEYKRSIDVSETRSVQKVQKEKMIERVEAYQEKWRAYGGTLPFPNFPRLK